ncbi:MAG: DUF4912 domain-containing protein [Candidatus Omnitrophota bacterium]
MKIFKKIIALLMQWFSKITAMLKSLFKKQPKIVKIDQQSNKNAAIFQETAIANTKFSHAQNACVVNTFPQELPDIYDQDKIVLQVRDPHWLHTYWEVKFVTIEGLKSKFGQEFNKARRVLRVYDVTNIIFNGTNANRFFDIAINDFANSWYIDAGPGRAWCVDLGLMLSDGRFITILRSNVVQTPLDGPSPVTDEEWMIPEEIFARLYGMGFGLGKSSPVGGAWQERIKQGLFSSGLSSSPVKKEIKERSFWLKVDCELIVYGSTEPDAKVMVQGVPIKLRSDGTFTLRYYLPDGKQIIPVKAVSSDKLEERTITPIVTRETK